VAIVGVACLFYRLPHCHIARSLTALLSVPSLAASGTHDS